jgi:hypothetical protein
MYNVLYIAKNYFLFFQIASDYGGPRKEFFRLILIEIKEKYFDKGLRERMADEYEVIGTIFGM